MSTTWVNATYCFDFFEDKEGFEDLIVREYDADWNWVCPDVTSITLNRDVFKLQKTEASSFVMVVNTCSNAKIIDEANGLTSYTTADCDEEAEADVW